MYQTERKILLASYEEGDQFEDLFNKLIVDTLEKNGMKVIIVRVNVKDFSVTKFQDSLKHDESIISVIWRVKSPNDLCFYRLNTFLSSEESRIKPLIIISENDEILHMKIFKDASQNIRLLEAPFSIEQLLGMLNVHDESKDEKQEFNLQRAHEKQKRVLVVNEDHELVKFLSHILSDQGYEVNYIEAITSRFDEEKVSEIIEQDKPDVLLWGISDPIMANWNYLKEIRNRKSLEEMRVLLLVKNEQKLRVNLRALGEECEDTIIGTAKDFDILALYEAIEGKIEMDKPEGQGKNKRKEME